MDGQPLGLTVVEVADMLRVSTRTVRRLIETGKLPVVYVGRTPFVPRSAIERMFDVGR